MKAVILAGGLGTRLGDITKLIPKPMVRIGKKPIIAHIIDIYVKYGIKEFIIALGYKGAEIKKYFNNNYKSLNIKLVNTGAKTMTGGRLKRLQKYLNNETFLLTYGDGLSNVDIKKKIKFHKKKKKYVTICAVRPPARFGGLTIKKEKVSNFEEKNQIREGWINGGFFVMEPKIFKFLKGDESILEREPLEKIVKINQMVAFKHTKFWMCMDTKRDKDKLEEISKLKKRPW